MSTVHSSSASSLPDKPVGALMNGLAILRYLSNANESLGVTRIARDLELNPSTCFNLLKTLAHEGLINFDETSKTYAIGLGVVELAKGALEQNSYVRMIRPHLQEIANRHQVTATLWQRTKGDRVVLLDLADSDSTIRVHMSIGQRLPMYVAALGRCMAAATDLSDDALREKFLALRWENRPSFEDYLKEIEKVRLDGYAVDEGHHVKGVTTVSSAVLDDLKRPVMAISAVGFSAQLSSSDIQDLGGLIQSKTQKISSVISVRPFVLV